MRIFFLVLFAVTIPFAAHAACTSPAGLASQTRYDSAANKMYYCNDANWIDMGGGAAGFSNPATSALNMNSNKITGLGTPTANTDAANKTYVDGKFGAQANGNWCRSNGTQVICDQTAPSATDKVAKAGDTMTGALTLSGTPTANNHAATKAYVDSVAAAAGGGQYQISCSGDGAGTGLSGYCIRINTSTGTTECRYRSNTMNSNSHGSGWAACTVGSSGGGTASPW